MLEFKTHKWFYREFTWVFQAKIDSPIIITIPHDQAISPNNIVGLFEPREKGIKRPDCHVWDIVRDILIAGVQVNVVRGLLPRAYMDYSRPAISNTHSSSAYNDSRLACFYESYHQAIDDLIVRSVRIFGSHKCLLIDLHGFSKQPDYGEYDLILGTGNRNTISSDVDQELARFFLESGYGVFLPKEYSVYPKEKYATGFTIRRCNKRFGIDAILIEIARKFRIAQNKNLGQKLSNNFAQYLTFLVGDL